MNNTSKVAKEKLKGIVHILSNSIQELSVSLFYIERLPGKDRESYYVGAHLVASEPIRDIKLHTELYVDEDSISSYYPRLGITFYLNSNKDGSYSIEQGSINLALFPYSPITFVRTSEPDSFDVVPLSKQTSLLGENLGFEVLERLKSNDGITKLDRKLRNACQNIGQMNTPQRQVSEPSFYSLE